VVSIHHRAWAFSDAVDVSLLSIVGAVGFRISFRLPRHPIHETRNPTMRNDLSDAFADYAKLHGRAAAREVIKNVSGQSRLDQVPAEQVYAVIAALTRANAAGRVPMAMVHDRPNAMAAAIFAQSGSR
jgi:hypothetical protein